MIIVENLKDVNYKKKKLIIDYLSIKKPLLKFWSLTLYSMCANYR